MPRYQGTNVGRPQGSVRWTCGRRFVSFRGKQGMGHQAWTFLKVPRYEVSGRHGRRLELQGNFRRSVQGPWRQRYQRYEIRRRRAQRFQNHPVPLRYKGTNFLADRERPGGQHQKIKAVRKVCRTLVRQRPVPLQVQRYDFLSAPGRNFGFRNAKEQEAKRRYENERSYLGRTSRYGL